MIRRFKQPTYPYYVSGYSDDDYDEPFPRLPMIVNTQPITIDERPYVYTPNLFEERPLALYRSSETPVRRFVRVSTPPTPPEKNVHLPKHTKMLVNRFLNNLEHAHDRQNINGNGSDSGIDGCDICRRLRSAMNEGQRQSTSDEDLYYSSRVVVENPSKHSHSKYCQVCHVLKDSHVSVPNRTKHDKHVHVIDTFPSNNPPVIQTGQTSIYPLGYTTFVDPTTGLTYAYDPSWQYNTNPVYALNNPQSYPPTMDKSTYTRMTDGDEIKQNSNDKTVVVHTARNPTPRSPKIIIEQPRRHRRRSRKNRATTIVTERTTRIPRTYTTSYI